MCLFAKQYFDGKAGSISVGRVTTVLINAPTNFAEEAI